MPHNTRTIVTDKKVVEKVLNTCTKWKDILLDVNVVDEKVGLEPISLSKLSIIKKANFSEYITKRRGDKFARCSNCEKLKRLCDAHTMGTESYIAHQLNYFKHVTYKRPTVMITTRIELCPYQSPWRSLWSSMIQWIMPKPPHRVLQIESKPQMNFSSYMFRLHVKVETISSHTLNIIVLFSKLYLGPWIHSKRIICRTILNPWVGVASMIAHGHGDVKFAHYALDLYPADSNHKIGSFARLLRDLEKPPYEPKVVYSYAFRFRNYKS